MPVVLFPAGWALMIDRRFRLARVWSNAELRKIGARVSGLVVNVSAGENIDKEGGSYEQYFPGAKSFALTNHDPGSFRGFQGRENETLLDLEAGLPTRLRRKFDVVFNHTTLEHVFEVRQAFRNLCDMSRDVVIVVVPFAQVQHENHGYADFWRFTPTCLRRMFAENGFEVVYESASPDRDAAVYLFFVGSRHPERWQGKMPGFNQTGEIGGWIGERRQGVLGLTGDWFRRKLDGWRKK